MPENKVDEVFNAFILPSSKKNRRGGSYFCDHARRLGIGPGENWDPPPSSNPAAMDGLL